MSFINDATPEQIGYNIAKRVVTRAVASLDARLAISEEVARTITARNHLHKQEILAMDEANQALKQHIEELESAAEPSEMKESNVNNEGFIPETFLARKGDRVTIKNKKTGVTLTAEIRSETVRTYNDQFRVRLDGATGDNFFLMRDWVIEEIPNPVKDGYYARGNLIYLKEGSQVIVTNLRHTGSNVVDASEGSPLRGNSAKAAEDGGYRFLGDL